MMVSSGTVTADWAIAPSAEAKATYDSPFTQMKTDLETLRKNINLLLTTAFSPILTATEADTMNK